MIELDLRKDGKLSIENAISRQVVLEKIDINKYFHPINQANVVKMMAFD